MDKTWRMSKSLHSNLDKIVMVLVYTKLHQSFPSPIVRILTILSSEASDSSSAYLFFFFFFFFEDIKLSLFSGNMLMYVENPKESILFYLFFLYFFFNFILFLDFT